MSQKSRGFCYTLNNYSQEEIAEVKQIRCLYHVRGYEVGQSGTPHIQGYIYFENPRSFNAVKKLMKRWHIEPTKGSPSDNIKYCKKDGKFEEEGNPPGQGKRTDLVEIKNQIINGEKTVDEITLENPMIFHQYGRTLNKIEELKNRGKFRTWMTCGIWYHGKTGVGKSHKAFEGYHPATHFVYNTQDNGYWNGYTGQETVIINDFRGQIPYSELLNLVDKWPHTVKIKCSSPTPFLAKKVIITSAMHPHHCYPNLCQEDKLAQLERRFTIIEMTGTEVVEGNTTPTVFLDL